MTQVVDPAAADRSEPFIVRWIDGSWFIGTEQMSQRIEGGGWLDTWLAANGEANRAALDFDGDPKLRERFIEEFGPVDDKQPGTAAEVA